VYRCTPIGACTCIRRVLPVPLDFTPHRPHPVLAVRHRHHRRDAPPPGDFVEAEEMRSGGSCWSTRPSTALVLNLAEYAASGPHSAIIVTGVVSRADGPRIAGHSKRAGLFLLKLRTFAISRLGSGPPCPAGATTSSWIWAGNGSSRALWRCLMIVAGFQINRSGAGVLSGPVNLHVPARCFLGPHTNMGNTATDLRRARRPCGEWRLSSMPEFLRFLQKRASTV